MNWLLIPALGAAMLFGEMSGQAASAKAYSNVEFARPDGKPLLLDVSIPKGKGPFPAAIIVHGGSWKNGDKTTYIKPLKPLLSDAGYAWFSIDYRLAPAYTFPANMNDVENAVKWVKANARKYHVDKKRLVLIGESAGGHLVAMVGAQNKPESSVAAVVDFYGPNNLSLLPQFLKAPPDGVRELLNITEWNDQSKKLLADASPQAFVHKGIPPFLFIHGTADMLVPPTFSPMMCEAIKKVDGTCEVVNVPGGVHGMENWEGKPGQTDWKPIMTAWLDKTVKTKPRSK